MTNNSLAYKDALNEIIAMQDSYMSSTPDTAAMSLMVKWREKVLEYSVRLKLECIQRQHAEALIKAENKKHIEELTTKYETTIADLKKSIILKQELDNTNNKNQELLQKLANSESYSKELNAQIATLQSQLSQSNAKFIELQGTYEQLAKEAKQKEENYKQGALNSEQQYTMLQQKFNSTIQTNEAIAKEKELLAQTQLAKLEESIHSLKTNIDSLTNEKNALISKLNIESNKIAELSANSSENEQFRAKLKEQSQVNERLKAISNEKDGTISDLNSEITSLKQLKEKVVKEKEELKSKYEKEIAELRKLLQRNTIEESTKYKKECDRITKDNMKLLNINSQLNDQVKKLKSEVSAKEATIKKLSSSYVPERLKPSDEEYKMECKRPDLTDAKAKKYEMAEKPKSVKSKPKRSEEAGEPFSTECVLNDDNIESEICKNIDYKTEVKVTDRMLNKLNHLQKLGELALEGI